MTIKVFMLRSGPSTANLIKWSSKVHGAINLLATWEELPSIVITITAPGSSLMLHRPDKKQT